MKPTSDLRRLVLAALAALVGLALAVPALAIPVEVESRDDPGHCDPLRVPIQVHELGNRAGGFPPEEQILSQNDPTLYPVCIPFYMGGPDELVIMTNLTNTDFTEVWYVADPETHITNWDGYVNGEEAFKIDSRISDPNGINHPLIFESLIPDDIFQAGETWQFYIQDYFNLMGIPASAFMSPGRVGVFSGGDPISSGSIIAIPEPGTLLLTGLALAGLALVGRKRL
jgi:hypothetical protein